MTLEEALDDMMRQFLAGEGNPELDKIQPTKYTLGYFDNVQEQLKNPEKPSRMERLKRSIR